MGGGVCLLMRDVVSFIQRNELTISNDYVEALFIEITKNEFIDYSILVGVIYRPPNTDLNKFNETMYQILDQLKSEKKSCVIMGDFNLNFCNYETHQLTNEFLNTMFSFMYTPVINDQLGYLITLLQSSIIFLLITVIKITFKVFLKLIYLTTSPYL